MPIRFDGQVAVITGAGGGLGRAYALALASLGAKVVVNDLGGSLSGDGAALTGDRPADKVVSEIRASGGIACADYHDVLEGDLIIDSAMSNFGRVDILVNNAGILRDASFAKMSPKDWDVVMQVHVKGAFMCTRAAWPHMQRQKFGRIVNTTSASGLYGNFGQANYGAAKMALIGMARTLAHEGAKANIQINCIAPLAGTRMTEGVMPAPLRTLLKPEHVAPLVLYLASKECRETGKIYEVGAGWVSEVRIQRASGHFFNLPLDVDAVHANFPRACDFAKDANVPKSLMDSIMVVSSRLPKSEDSANSPSPTGAKACARSETIFRIIQKFLDTQKAKTQELQDKLNSCLQFEISETAGRTPDLVWCIELRKNSPGRAFEGRSANADATFTLTDEAFVCVCVGKLNPQIAFMQGKMKIKGSMQKASAFTPSLFPKISLDILSLSVDEAVQAALKGFEPEDKSPAKASAVAGDQANVELSPAAAQLKSAQLYRLMKAHLASPTGAALVKQVNCMYRINIMPKPNTPASTFYINLKSVPAWIKEMPFSSDEKFDCSFTMVDDVFFSIATGKTNPQLAFMQGKMKIKGSTAAAMKFTKDMFPKQSKL